MAFLKSILHGSSLAVGCDLGISSLGLQSRFLINLSLSITDLQGILLHCSSGLSISSNGLFQSKTKFRCITLQASALPLDSASRAVCMESRTLVWFFFTIRNSSSFSASLRSISEALIGQNGTSTTISKVL